MAIYHLSVKTISRSAGRSSTAAAAYRSGEKIVDQRTGEIHDYTRKQGVESAFLVPPENAPEWASDRERVWNEAEQSERRKNSTVAREFEIALPSELSAEKREELAREFARELVARHGCIADVAIHAPSQKGDDRNHHAHILLSTRRLTVDGFGEKTRELDDQKTGPQLVTEWRSRFAELQNEHLKKNGIEERVDHRTLEAQGIEREPMPHLGPAATAIRRRTKDFSKVESRTLPDIMKRMHARQNLGRQLKQIDADIEKISAELREARAQQQKKPEPVAKVISKISDPLPGQTDLEKMPFAELKELLLKSRVPDAKELAAQDPVLVENRARLLEMKKIFDDAKAQQQQAERRATEWRQNNPMQAKMHKSGLWRNPEIKQIEQNYTQAIEIQERVQPAYQHAREAWLELQQETIRRIEKRQQPARDFYRKVDGVFTQRFKEEKNKDMVLQKFAGIAAKREAKAIGWQDTGKRWNAVPDALKREIERFNGLPESQKKAELEQIKQRPEAFKALEKSIEHYRQKERDIDQGLSR